MWNADGGAEAGRISILSEASPSKIEEGWIHIETPEGESRLPWQSRHLAHGVLRARGFVESMAPRRTPPTLDRQGAVPS